MRRSILSALLILGLSFLVIGQQPIRPPRETVQQQISRENSERRQRQAEQRESDRALGMDDDGLLQIRTNGLLGRVKEIYREPTKEELGLLAPDVADRERFAGFLSKKNTGLIRLIPDAGCADNPYTVSASEDCLKFQLPGAGASYSFRKETYVIPTIADLTLKDGFFLTSGTLIQGILVDIGNVPIENVADQTNGLSYLSNFKPETEPVNARAVSHNLAEGIRRNGFFYRSSLPVRADRTYLLRSIAYRGFIQRSIAGFIYDESRWDKRKDITVAFRVVQTDSDGGVTILWKRLKMKDAPKMRF